MVTWSKEKELKKDFCLVIRLTFFLLVIVVKMVIKMLKNEVETIVVEITGVS